MRAAEYTGLEEHVGLHGGFETDLESIVVPVTDGNCTFAKEW